MNKNASLYVIVILLLFKVIFCLSEHENENTNENVESIPSITSSSWNLNDTYTLKYSNNKFSADKDYILFLEKEAEKDFTILNLTDIQLNDLEIINNVEEVLKINKTIEELVQKIKPDLITVTGDQGYGTKISVQFVGNLIDQYNIPWAPVFGNHDNDETELNTSQQAYLYENEFKNCLFKAGPNNLATLSSNSVAWGNYIINVVEKDESKNKFHIVKSLIFLNSGCTYDYKSDAKYNDQKRINPTNYSMLSPTQISWYKWAVKSVQEYGLKGKVKSAIFLHIPVYAYNTAFAAAYNVDIDIFDYREYAKAVNNTDVFNSYADKSIWNEGYENSVGGYRETICSSPYDDHFLEAIKNVNGEEKSDYTSTDLIVAGHDHINDFIVQYQGVTFAYGLKTGGAGNYCNEDLSGGSVILVRDSGKSIIYHQFVNIESGVGRSNSKLYCHWWIYLINIIFFVKMFVF